MAKQRVARPADRRDVVNVNVLSRKISVELSQTVQLAKFHPCTATVGVEVELDAVSDLEAAKDAITQEASCWLDNIMREKIEAGLDVLTDMGKTLII